VERVKKLAPKDELNQSYAEIRNFEWQRQQQGSVVVKFWMDITKKEQWHRFEDRKENEPQKFSQDDLDAREKWTEYTRMANAMFFRTGTKNCPWNIISAEDKRYSRVTVLQIINETLRAELGVK